MTHAEIREKFVGYFKQRRHAVVPSSSLLPTDPSVLFTTAGMQQFKPYYTGEADAMRDFNSLNTTSIQKCIRTSDIDEIGDGSHLSFFEMLGNFSFGGYFKKEAIGYAYEFITKGMGLKIDFVSVFGGEDGVPEDIDSQKCWKEIDPTIEIKKFRRKDNFWGPTGNMGPCGPTSEIYVNGIEVWNLVFNQYYQDESGKVEPLKTPGIDTGMGLERLAMAVQKKNSIFETDLFEPIFSLLPSDQTTRVKRIISDHIRAIVFMIADGMRPSNKDQGYILRRLMRRVMVYQIPNISDVIKGVVETYKEFYSNLDFDLIHEIISEEKNKFEKTMATGIKELNKISNLNAQNAFKLFESYGLPFEVIKELAGEKAKDLHREEFDEEFKKHQDLSRTASAGMFKGGLADTSVETTRLHTAAHLMLEAMRRVLGNGVQQKGSNITAERLRFDFSHSEKLTPGQITEIEKIVNEQIEKKLSVHFEEMTVDEAKKLGATGVFEHKYGDKVKVYFIGNEGDYYSKEICGGPHVTNTSEIGHFKITKEESAGAGIRRIKAVIL